MNKQNISLAIVIATVLIFGAVPMTTSVQAEDDGEFVGNDGGEDGSGDSGGESTDDGYVYPDDSTPEEQQEQDEQEQQAWEDAGSPGKEPEQTFTCSVDGSIVTEAEDCPSTGPLPYCDTPAGKAASGCHDRFDTDSETGMATCNDGTHKKDPLDCKDATNKDLPRCEYKVVQDCIVNDLGQTCEVGTSDDPCQDVFYGWDGANYKPGEKIVDPTPAPASSGGLKNCGDGVVAVSCGVGRYWCVNNQDKAIHTNDLNDC